VLFSNSSNHERVIGSTPQRSSPRLCAASGDWRHLQLGLTSAIDTAARGVGVPPRRVCAMDPTREQGHEHHDKQGAEGRGANAAAPSTTSTTSSLLGEEGGVVQELTEAMAAARVTELRPTPDPGLGLGPGPGPDADLEADEQRHQPQPPKAPPATMTGAAGATTRSTATTAVNDHGGAAVSPPGPGPGPGFSFSSVSGTNEATTKVRTWRGTPIHPPA
jgi:hypothetical protein